MPPPHASTVFVVVYSDSAAAAVLGVYADLGDANDECRKQAAQAGVAVDMGTSEHGDAARWTAADGASCWVESHAVKAKRSLSTAV
ncbi:hypothetical protein HIM_06762 [Hirsutella minnesotensis 3608]|uniref:Uncharacterized protein n=1 Tax=Hirsutella minnesotensis 3608 TaxID=1043627 RepID=A0A0F8A4N1_9HYPO|nr:hypothetical protein HIM_06762 [Hirsutella minnesotensis 3608]